MRSNRSFIIAIVLIKLPKKNLLAKMTRQFDLIYVYCISDNVIRESFVT